MIVVDTITGKLHRTMPFRTLVLPGSDMGLRPYAFRLGSRLLVVQGYLDVVRPTKDTECSRRPYEWTGASFKLVKKTPSW
jgi:hypothetical protein